MFLGNVASKGLSLSELAKTCVLILKVTALSFRLFTYVFHLNADLAVFMLLCDRVCLKNLCELNNNKVWSVLMTRGDAMEVHVEQL